MLIQVSLVLPYLLRLPNGVYPTGAEGGMLSLRKQYVAEQNTKRTVVSAEFDAPAFLDLKPQFTLKNREAEALLKRTNRLIRWYRAETRQAAVVEVTKAQASPFVFAEKDTKLPWGDELPFEASAPILPTTQSIQSVARAVKKGLASKNDPEVSRLFLLDAEQALRDGRFRETVLFCWSAIDSTFSQKYKSLVQGAVDVPNEREALTNFRNASMRYRMSAGLYFCTGKSLYEQPDGLWTNLLESYSKRNSIIHDGASAQETDAELALSVARQVVKVMASLKPKDQKNKPKDQKKK